MDGKRNNHPISVRIDPDLDPILRDEAKRKQRSLNWMINRFVREGLKPDHAQAMPAGESA